MDAALDTLPLPASHFSPMFCVPTRHGRVLQLAPTAPCQWCCHWTLPLAQRPRPTSFGVVALSYVEWLIWHWHVRHHQQGVPLA